MCLVKNEGVRVVTRSDAFFFYEFFEEMRYQLWTLEAMRSF